MTTIPTDHFVTIARGPAETRPLPAEEPAPTPAPDAEQRPTHRLPALTWRQQFAVTRRIWADRLVRGWPALLAGATLAALLLLASLAPRLAATPAAAAPPAPTPPLAVPTATRPAVPVLPVALIAYDAPAGRRLGDLSAGLAYTVLAQAEGGAWLQLDAGSGPVWVEAAAWGEAPIVRAAALADLTPPTPIPPTAVVLPPRVEVVYVAAPTAPPAPPAELTPLPEAPGWHPPMAAGYDPGASAECPLILAPERLAACQAGRP